MQLASPSATGLADSCLLYKIKSTPGANNWQHQHIIPEPTCSDSPSHCLVSRASFLIRFSILYPQGGSRSLWFNLLHKCLRRYPNRWISVKKRKNKRTLPGVEPPSSISHWNALPTVPRSLTIMLRHKITCNREVFFSLVLKIMRRVKRIQTIVTATVASISDWTSLCKMLDIQLVFASHVVLTSHKWRNYVDKDRT